MGRPAVGQPRAATSAPQKAAFTGQGDGGGEDGAMPVDSGPLLLAFLFLDPATLATTDPGSQQAQSDTLKFVIET